MLTAEAFRGLSESEIEDFLQKIERGRDDEVFFFKEFLGLDVHPGQEKWSQESHDVINLLSCGNKWGKTAFTAGRHIHKNFYKLGANGEPEEVQKMEYQTLVISPVSAQSVRTQQYIEQILTSSFSWEDPKTGLRKTNKCKIEWFFIKNTYGEKAAVYYLNGSRTDVRSIGDDKGSKIQGSDYYYISYDEYPRSRHLEEEMDGNILPRLATYGGNLDLIGTPDKDSPSLQYIYELIEEAQQEDSQYYFQGGSMMDNYFVSEANKLRTLGAIRDEETKKQVQEGTLIFPGGKMFDPPAIARIWIPGMEWIEESEELFAGHIDPEWANRVPAVSYSSELQGYVSELPPIIDGYMAGKYLIAMDWHLSDGGDETVIYVIRYDVKPYRIVYYLATKRGNPYVKHAKVRFLHKVYNNASLVVDSQGVGRQLSYDLEDLDPSCFDWTSQGKEKKVMLQILKNYINWKEGIEVVGRFRSPRIKELSKQLSAYREDDAGIKQDHVMTLGVSAWWLENNGGFIVTPPDRRR